MRSREEIERILTADLEIAMSRFRSAEKIFREVIASVPGGLPHPDGSLRIQQVAQEKIAAAGNLRRALSRHNEFMLSAKTPEDLDGE